MDRTLGCPAEESSSTSALGDSVISSVPVIAVARVLTYLAPAIDGAIDESRAVGLRVVIGHEICNFRLLGKLEELSALRLSNLRTACITIGPVFVRGSNAFNALFKAFLNALLGLVCILTDTGRPPFGSIKAHLSDNPKADFSDEPKKTPNIFF